MGRDSQRRRQLKHLYHNQGLSIRQIAEILNQSATTIYRWLDEEGIERREPGRPSESPPYEELQTVYSRYRGNIADIARYYNRPEPTVRSWLKRCGLDKPHPAPPKHHHDRSPSSLRRVASDMQIPQLEVKPIKRKRR